MWPPLLVAVVLALAGCGGGSNASPSPNASDDSPYASGETPGPTLNVDPQVCDAMRSLAAAVAAVKAVKLGRTTRDDLLVAFGNVSVAMEDVRRFAPDALRARVRTLGYAVTDLGLSVEDYRTTDRPDLAAPDIDRKGKHGRESAAWPPALDQLPGLERRPLSRRGAWLFGVPNERVDGVAGGCPA